MSRCVVCASCNAPFEAGSRGRLPSQCQACKPRSPSTGPRQFGRRSMRADRSRYFTLAHAYVSTAIYNGDLPKLDGSVACVDCGIAATEYDHRDYKKPMEVDPVCRACNQARGPGLHRDPSETGEKPPTIYQRFLNREQAA